MSITYIVDPGTNFNGSMKELKELALMAKKAGATHFKPQIYQAKQLYSPIDNEYFELQNKCSLTLEQCQEIFDYCNEIKISPMFSCFSVEYFNWLEEIGCKNLKIAASISGNAEFVIEASNYGFDVFVSFSKEHPHFSKFEYMDIFKNVKFMSCVSKYPSSLCDYNLKEIEVLEGLSDHCPDINLPIAAVSRGANVIEKHVWFRYHDTPDIGSSVHTFEFEQMVHICNEIEKIR